MFVQRLQKRLSHQRQSGLYRNPPEIALRQGKYLTIDGREKLNFAANDYLGLGACEELREKVADNFRTYGPSSASSRLVSGNHALINRAEKAYARYFGYDDAIFFPSGYQANIGLLSALFEPGDVLCFDKHIHASAVKGMALSRARFHGYNHNSMVHLEKRLKKNAGTPRAVVTESLFSMDGDRLDIQGLQGLKTTHRFLCIVDEAHAFGALGEKGRGIARPVTDVAVGTFGKALGLFGAFVLLPKGFKEYLFNFSSPLIYTTTLPEAHAASAMDLLEIVSRSDQARADLKTVSRRMKQALQAKGYTVSGDAHILAVEIGKEEAATALARRLFERDIFVFPARYPTVPLGRAILRISMTALHTEADVAVLIRALEK